MVQDEVTKKPPGFTSFIPRRLISLYPVIALSIVALDLEKEGGRLTSGRFLNRALSASRVKLSHFNCIMFQARFTALIHIFCSSVKSRAGPLPLMKCWLSAPTLLLTEWPGILGTQVKVHEGLLYKGCKLTFTGNFEFASMIVHKHSRWRALLFPRDKLKRLATSGFCLFRMF